MQWQNSGDNAIDAPKMLKGMIFGYMPAQVIYVAARLGIADRLDGGAQTSAELAEATGADKPSLERLLRALACFRVVVEDESGRYALGPTGGPLRSDAPDTVRELVMHIGGEALWRSWGELLHGITTGESAFQHVYRTDYFDYLEHNPGPSETFNLAMAELTGNVIGGVVGEYDFSRYSTVVDVGGGNGTLIAAILDATPGLTGILFDTPTGVEQCAKTLADAGIADRCEVRAGNFFESVPEDGDAYVLKSVLHDWDDDRSTQILRTCARAMSEGDRIVLIEPAQPAGANPGEIVNTVISDLNMFVLNGGRERSEEEFATLFAAAGLRITSVVPVRAGTHHTVVEGVLDR